ncbi:hypothetical protein BKN38_07025 [Helicobacter sp. CLO-3]|uniref:Gfo/Idh/MocA family protein n=1 Tax=unclassified Helicobacter TaxID=2593540 RepID=UPI00080508F0|nr:MULTISPECIES: Gfo/Idh/MocA family oxidoreductase [unclassified Helicobacter]OBV28600.1 hypothetical protein BA723_01640 [Helicobacter sp. CLO-3]OHU82519.1 hypothetical protein BKN38_07025 [Helicobacter sp. CLO-3]
MKVALVGYGYWGRNVLKALIKQNLAYKAYQARGAGGHDADDVDNADLAESKSARDSKNRADFTKSTHNAESKSTPESTALDFEIIGVYDTDMAQCLAAASDYQALIQEGTESIKTKTRANSTKSNPPESAFAESTLLDSAPNQSALHIYPTFEDLLADECVEAVFIITPPQTHYTLAKRALQARKHIFVEKPLATSLKECAELYALASKLGLIVHCDHIFLYAPAVEWLKRHLAIFGEVLYVQARRINLGLFQNSVDVIWDLALHDLSILDYLWGLDVRSHHTLRTQYQGFDALADIHLELKNASANINANISANINANISVSWLSPIKVREMMIGGAKKTAIYDETKSEKLAIFDCGIVVQDVAKDSLYRQMVQYHLGEVSHPTLPKILPLERSIYDFYAQIKAKRMRAWLTEHTLRVVGALERISSK